MFKKFFGNRVKKDIATLEAARKKMLVYLQSKGLSQDEIIQVEHSSWKKATVKYMNKPDVQATLNVYSESLKEEIRKLGYTAS